MILFLLCSTVFSCTGGRDGAVSFGTRRPAAPTLSATAANPAATIPATNALHRRTAPPPLHHRQSVCMRGGPSMHRRRRAPVRRYLLPPPVYCHVGLGPVPFACRAPRLVFPRTVLFDRDVVIILLVLRSR